MNIYDKDPMLVLWELFRDFDSDTVDRIPVYKEVMTSKTAPDSYILLRSQMTDSTNIYGDGNSLLRLADNDAILVSKGYAEDTTDLHNINKARIAAMLKENGVTYETYNLGYDDDLKSTQQTYSIEINYYG